MSADKGYGFCRKYPVPLLPLRFFLTILILPLDLRLLFSDRLILLLHLLLLNLPHILLLFTTYLVLNSSTLCLIHML